jgi:hypothetical protein
MMVIGREFCHEIVEYVSPKNSRPLIGENLLDIVLFRSVIWAESLSVFPGI